MVRHSLNPCLPVIHQETNFLHFLYEGPSVSAHCVMADQELLGTTHPAVLFVLNQTAIIERKHHFQTGCALMSLASFHVKF